MRLTKRTLDQIDPPVGTADELREMSAFDDLLDLSQGAPAYPTAPSIIERVSQVVQHPDGARYTGGKGLPDLRSALADDLCADYESEITEENVVITAGANQAFCLVTSALAETGDEVVLTAPYYFNHDMWVRLDQSRPVYVDTSPTSGQVAVSDVAASLTATTRMIVVTSPGNPTGVTADPEVVDELADLARSSGVVLVLDETYRSFRSHAGPPHRLFQRPDWSEYFVSIQSFSKDYAIPGYRVGAVIGAPALLDEVMKLMDCIAICAPRIGQEAALEGLRSAQEWRVDRAREVALKHERFVTVMRDAPGGFQLQSSGGFYGWVRHPQGAGETRDVVRRLAVEFGILAIPGDTFTPTDRGFVRFSFANVDLNQLSELGSRLTLF